MADYSQTAKHFKSARSENLSTVTVETHCMVKLASQQWYLKVERKHVLAHVGCVYEVF